MRIRIVFLAALLLTTGCSRAYTPATDGPLEGTVTYVYDGDTVSLRARGKDHRVRLQGIDAPEHDQPYGDAARDHLRRLVLNQDVRLETTGKDKYGRLLGKLRVEPADCRGCGKTLDANLAMLTVGLAWYYRFFKDELSPEDQGRYEFAEYEAKAKRAGLWQDDNPTPPWDWPRGDRKASKPSGECRIKGNISENGRIYHLPGQKHYERTRINNAKGERWFCSEAEARAAGWRRARD
jgi:endonuclease YncB( thermonuclease family)